MVIPDKSGGLLYKLTTPWKGPRYLVTHAMRTPSPIMTRIRIESEVPVYAARVIHSKVPAATGTRRDYELWKTITFSMRLDTARDPIPVVYDTGCNMALIGRRVVAQEISKPVIKTLPAAVLVKGIGTRRHTSSEYLVVDGYVDGMVDGHHVHAECFNYDESALEKCPRSSLASHIMLEQPTP